MKWILIFYDILFIFLYNVSVRGNSISQEHEIVISLANYDNSLKNGQAFYNYSLLNNSSKTFIDITNVPSEVSFIIIQIHAQESNVTLIINGTKTSKISGYNVGLQINSSEVSDTKISIENDNYRNVSVLVAAVAYTSNAPIPGGCNMEFETEIAPFQKLNQTDAIVRVDAQPASEPEINDKQNSCDKNLIKYQSYRLYISTGDFTDETYFSSISKFLTVDGIINNGEISPDISTSSLSRIYSAYPGTGSVYAIIATFDNYSAAYVPQFSYACGPVSNSDTCYLLKTSMSKFLCAAVFFIGVFFIFIGYRYLILEIILLGSITGGILGYIILNIIGMPSQTWQISATIIIGLVVGIFCSYFYYAKRPCVSILQASFSLGALIANNSTYHNNAAFWAIYVAICLVVTTTLCTCQMSSIMICYSILGAYAIILPFDYWLGANLKYIIINTIRRVSVTGFDSAIIEPPIQTTDIVLSVFWIILAIFGFYMQCRGLQGRSPFPSCTTRYTTIASRNRYPTLSNQRGGRRVLVLTENDHIFRA
ncbi:hypothetical protein PV326_001261 [Microctonus aethiopoides]|nr:hypothetical protein PV326_001261 [Microctonus aethiopoides]